MDHEIYNLILEERGEDPYSYQGKNGRGHTDQTGIRHFRSDILKGKTIWVNSKLYDFRLYISSNHPLIGLCTASKVHPFSRNTRIIRLISIFCVSVFYAALLTTLLFALDLQFVEKNLTSIDIRILTGSIINGLILIAHSSMIKKVIRFIHICCTQKSIFDILFWSMSLLIMIIAVCVIILHFHINGLLIELLIIFAFQTIIYEFTQFLMICYSFRKGWKRDEKMMNALAWHKGPLSLIATKSECAEDYIDEKEVRNKACPYHVTYMDYEHFLDKNPEYDVYGIRGGGGGQKRYKKSTVPLSRRNKKLKSSSLEQPLITHSRTEDRINKESIVRDALDELDAMEFSDDGFD